MGVVTLAEPTTKPNIYGKRSFRHSSSVGRHAATEWPMSDVTSDLTLEVGGATFALHKFPLVSRSGRIRKLLADAGKEPKITRMNLAGIPGGWEAFELAAKFCYGVAVDVSLSNVAVLNAVAVFLEMTEDISEGNLEGRTEAFLNDVVFPDISNSVSVLHLCESLLPFSDAGTGLVGRLVDSVANNMCKEQLASGLSKLDHHRRTLLFPPPEPTDEEALSDFWANSLAVLGVDLFKRVVFSLRGKGLKQEIITKILINYARQNSIHGVDEPRLGHVGDTDEAEKKQRKIVEAITNLLPKMSRKGTTVAVPVAFLSCLFKTAMAVSASASCRSDLERRISLQLDEAILEDILVPAPSPDPNRSNDESDPNNDKDMPLFDTDCVSRIFSFFLNLEHEDDEDDLVLDEEGMVYDIDSLGSPKQSTIIKASKLMDSFLAEVALDPNLTHSKFIALAELLPDHARLASDGLYRAVDIFLKVHPNMSDSEKHRLCKTIDCQKLTQEACSHAAQNDRLPVQMAVQVLYFEQIRMRNAMSGGSGGGGYTHHHHSHHQAFLGPLRSGSAAGSACMSPRDNYASVRRENRELKLEVARMRMRLTDLEKDHVFMKEELVRPHRAANNFLKSFTKKLCKINTLFRGKGSSSSEGRCRFQKRRRHSVS